MDTLERLESEIIEWLAQISLWFAMGIILVVISNDAGLVVLGLTCCTTLIVGGILLFRVDRVLKDNPSEKQYLMYRWYHKYYDFKCIRMFTILKNSKNILCYYNPKEDSFHYYFASDKKAIVSDTIKNGYIFISQKDT